MWRFFFKDHQFCFVLNKLMIEEMDVVVDIPIILLECHGLKLFGYSAFRMLKTLNHSIIIAIALS
jgi:hypothetical protein